MNGVFSFSDNIDIVASACCGGTLDDETLESCDVVSDSAVAEEGSGCPDVEEGEEGRSPSSSSNRHKMTPL